jgi:hypothetical protein
MDRRRREFQLTGSGVRAECILFDEYSLHTHNFEIDIYHILFARYKNAAKCIKDAMIEEASAQL